MRAEAMIVDYDFTLGRTRRLRGSGWRGLAALAMLFALRAMLITIIVLSARPGDTWLTQFLRQLLGG